MNIHEKMESVTLNITEINRIKEEVKVWAIYNFPTTTPEYCILGLYEELGELCHAILKDFQGIRKEDFEAAKKDAIGDIAIYFLDYLIRSDSNFINPDNTKKASFHFKDDILSTIEILSIQISSLRDRNSIEFINEGKIETSVEMINTQFIFSLYNLCAFFDYNFLEILRETWDRVKKRDWIKFPQNGLTL